MHPGRLFNTASHGVKAMADRWQTIQNGIQGMVSGSLGGLIAGYLQGLIFSGLAVLKDYRMGYTLEDEFLFVFAYSIPFSIFGLLIGSLAGGVIGLTSLVNHRSLRRLTQLLGTALVALPTVVILLEELTPLWLMGIVMLGSLFTGNCGGTIAYRCYQRLSNYLLNRA
jgi:hypothetical protein